MKVTLLSTLVATGIALATLSGGGFNQRISRPVRLSGGSAGGLASVAGH